jgi:group II intron reverse transcriptase/maturase
MLGVPTVADRVAQTVVAARLEQAVEPIFHPDSYGYRPGRSALDAVAACRKRCWKKDWLIDLDVEKFSGSVRWDLILKAVQAHTALPWVLLYVRRWLAAPLQLPGGTLLERDRGTAQGSAVSPVLANLFMHYALDAWLTREYPGVQFERYADDAVVHCATRAQAREVLAALQNRMEEAGCGCTRPRPGSSTARTAAGAARMSTRRSRSRGSPSAPARRAVRTGSSSPRSCPRSARMPWPR